MAPEARAGLVASQSRRLGACARRLGLLLAALIAVAALPATAAAHGPVAPVATVYLARIHSVPPGLEAKIVDGYVRMWLRVPAADEVIVPDYEGAPYLRFDRSGVAVNQNSTMYYLNEVPAAATPPADLSRTTPPDWHQLSRGHTYEWHDGRLQGLASEALLPGLTDLGVWRVPLIVNGHQTAISGELDHGVAPSILWFWPILVMLCCVLAAWRLCDAELDARIARWLALAALAGITVAAVARGLHGRPSVPAFQYGELAVVLAFVAWALRRLLPERTGYVIPLVVAFVALWEGLNLIPSLLRHYVLLALPPSLSRVATVLCLACGLSIIVLLARLSERSRRGAIAALLLALGVAGCGSATRAAATATISHALIAERRQIGVGPRFQSPVSGPVTGPCRRGLGRRLGVHVEVFAANLVVLIPAGIGARAPLHRTDGRISSARCFGELVTVDPTGIVLLRPGARLSVGALFRSWGEPLSRTRLLSFAAGRGRQVTVYVGGRRWPGAPGAVPLRVHSEIVLEVGPHVPPHRNFTFPPGT